MRPQKFKVVPDNLNLKNFKFALLYILQAHITPAVNHSDYISNKSTNQMQQFLKFYYLTFMYSSTCFVRPHAHHQELNNCSSSHWFYRWSVVVAVLLVVVGTVVTGPTATNSTATTALQR
jgi:hypothetical protein